MDLTSTEKLKESISLLKTISEQQVNGIDNVNDIMSLLEPPLEPDEGLILSLKLYIINYWDRLITDGLGLAQIDDLIMLIMLIRFIILCIRYNITTAAGITAIGAVAAYLWYSALLGTIFMFEQLLYQNTLTFRLAKDSYQLRTILQGKVRAQGYQTRLTNPIGILGYAIGNGIIHDGHFIDPLAMTITKLPSILSNTPIIKRFNIDVVGPYYYLVRKLIPELLRLGMRIVNQLTLMGSYAFFTRVNKKYCPYLIRWHWTTLMTFQFMSSFYICFIVRIIDYKEGVVYPRILEAKKYYLTLAQKEFEMDLLANMVFILLIGQIICLLIGMLHALCGQYFFLPFFTKNVELHIGKRNPSLIWAGGHTAWQEDKEKGKWWFLPKIWYGWFGRGTTTPNAFFAFLMWAFYRPVYKLVRRILKIFRGR